MVVDLRERCVWQRRSAVQWVLGCERRDAGDAQQLRGGVGSPADASYFPVCMPLSLSLGSESGGPCLQGNSLAAREVSRLAATRSEGGQAAGAAAPAGDATVEQLHEAARAGSAQAQNELGRRYDSGDGVQKDRNAALLFLKLAADQGLAAAQNSLAETLCARLACVTLPPCETPCPQLALFF
jgi:hypothetical protein